MRSITLALGSEPLPTQVPTDEGIKEIDGEHTLEAMQQVQNSSQRPEGG